MSRRRQAADTAALAAAGVGIVVLIAVAVVISPIIVMLGTDYLHNSFAAVPELGFVQSLVAVITARALLGTGGGGRRPKE